MKTFIALFTVCALLLLASTTLAGTSTNYALTPDVLASGGQSISSASYSIVSTAGQPLIGSNGSVTYSACSGYWCEIITENNVYLPLILKNF